MKPLKRSIKVISLLLAGIILLQSCSTYKKPVTLQQASESQKSVMIITGEDNAQEYKYIMAEDGLFYGVKDNPGEDVKFTISAEEVKAVLMKKGLPWWAWTLIVVGGILVIGLIICATGGCGLDTSDMDWGGSYAELK